MLIPLRCEARLHHHVDDPRHRRSAFAFLQVCGERRALRIQLRGREQFLAGLLAIGGVDTQAQEEHSLQPVAEGIVVFPVFANLLQVILHDSQGRTGTLVLRGSLNVILRIDFTLRRRANVEGTIAKGFLHETQAGHGYTGRSALP